MTDIDVPGLLGDGRLDRIWRAALELLDAGPITVHDTADALALWDVETFGAPRAALLGVGPAGERLGELTEHERALVAGGRYAVGTVGSYLVARMTRGVWHVVDAATAERLRITALTDVPESPLVVSSDRDLGPTDPAVCGVAVPIRLCGG